MRIVKRVGLLVVFITLGLVIIKVPLEMSRDLLKSMSEGYGLFAGIAGAIMRNVIIFSLMLLLAWLFTTRVDKSQMEQVGLFKGRKSLRLLCLGAAITLVAGGATSAFYVFLNGPDYVVLESGIGTVAVVLVLGVISGLFQAGFEGVWCRSWSLKAIADLVGQPVAACIMGGLFGLLHIFNPEYSAAAMVCTAAGGVMMCYAVFHTRSIWMAVGIHFGWNFIISGMFFNRFLFEVVSPEGETIRFTEVEASLPASVLTVAAMVFVVLLPKILGRDRIVDQT